MLGQLMLSSAVVAVGLILCVWVVSLRLEDASIIDVCWGIGFVLIGAVCLSAGNGNPGRRLVLAAIAGLWGLRLAVHIGLRNHGRGEDFRYARLRERDGDRFWLTSLYRVYLVQAALMWLVALPLDAGSAGGRGAGLGWLDFIGLAVWAVGLAFEAMATPGSSALILVRLTGKPLLESTIGERRPGYADYVRRTSGFVPLPPRRRAVG
jgi:steroid 5-alpha reductase family enzyme